MKVAADLPIHRIVPTQIHILSCPSHLPACIGVRQPASTPFTLLFMPSVPNASMVMHFKLKYGDSNLFLSPCLSDHKAEEDNKQGVYPLLSLKIISNQERSPLI